ncbi:MAG: Tn3 family transposase [Candidatus Latescibacterota bacterium]
MSADPLPSEHFLTHRQRRTPIMLPLDPTDEDLARNWTLSERDRKEALRCRGEAQRRRFALQLRVLAIYGRFLHPQDAVPVRTLNHLAFQLGLAPVIVPDPPPAEDTEQEHLQRIRQHLGYRVFDATAQEDLERWIDGLAREGRLPREIFQLAEHELAVRRKVVLPAPSTLERMVASACARGREGILGQVETALSPTMRSQLDGLLEAAEGRRSRFFRFKGQPPEARPEVILDFIEQWRELKVLGVSEIDVGFLSPKMVAHLADLADHYDRHMLERFAPAKRHALMACYLVERFRWLLDQLVDLNAQYLAGMSRRSLNAISTRRRRQFPAHRVRRSTDTMREALQLVVDRFAHEDVLLRSDFYSRVSDDTAREALVMYEQYWRLEERGYVDGLLSRHSYLRRYLGEFLQLPFEASTGSEPLREAIEIARSLPPGKHLPADTSDRVVPPRLRAHVRREDGTLDRRLWEVGLAMTIKESLKAGDLYLPSSKRHVSFANMIYSDDRWAQERPRAYEELSLPTEPKAALDGLRAEFEGVARQVEQGLATNPFVGVGEEGLRLHRGQEDRYDPPRSVRNLRRAIEEYLPEVRIEDLLWKVESECGFLKEFTPPGDRDSRVENLPVALMAAIVAQGTNLGVAGMAKSNQEVSADTLQHVVKWYVREDAIRAANASIVDYINRLPLASVWGDGAFSSSDGQRFAIRGSSLLGSFYPRYFGYYERGITVLTHTSNQFSVFATQAISCSEREAMYVLEGLLENDTVLRHRDHTTDTHGFTEQLFGLCFLLGFSFMPRLADLADQQLYKLDRATTYGSLEPVFRGTLDLDLAEEQWDELVRVVASMKHRTAKTQDVMQRLINASPADRLAKALTALGRAVKTIFGLRYISDEGLRRRIQLQLNRGEARHHLAKHLFWSHRGEFSRGDLQEVMCKASCLSLLSNAVIAWNIQAMDQILSEMKREGRLVSEEDLAHVWPLAWKHVSPNGMFRFTPQVTP